jgi:hypothetical protein
MRITNISSLAFRHTWSLFLPILFLGSTAHAASSIVQTCCSTKEAAFAQYVGLQGQRIALAAPGPTGVIIEATLPELYKTATLFGVRAPGQDEKGNLMVLQIEGDGTVAQEVIDRYLALKELFDAIPQSSVAVTPANYKFRFAGEVKTGDSAAYMYNITPKKNRPGLLEGQLWMDSTTGHEVMLTGHLVDLPASAGFINIVRDTKVLDGSAFVRVTHLTFSIPNLGRAEVVTTEFPLNMEPPMQRQ